MRSLHRFCTPVTRELNRSACLAAQQAAWTVPRGDLPTTDGAAKGALLSRWCGRAVASRAACRPPAGRGEGGGGHATSQAVSNDANGGGRGGREKGTRASQPARSRVQTLLSASPTGYRCTCHTAKARVYSAFTFLIKLVRRRIELLGAQRLGFRRTVNRKLLFPVLRARRLALYGPNPMPSSGSALSHT